MKILVIDDEVALKDIYLGFLAKVDASAKFCDHPQKGWQAIDKEQYDLIITDLKMPVISGEELISIVRSSKLNAHTPIILCSAHINKLVMTEMSRESKIYFLAKPFDSATLLALVNRAVGVKQKSSGENLDLRTKWLGSCAQTFSDMSFEDVSYEKLENFELWNFETISIHFGVAGMSDQLNVTLMMKLKTFLKIAGKIQGTQYKEIEAETLHVWQKLVDAVTGDSGRLTFTKSLGQEFIVMPDQKDAFYKFHTSFGEVLAFLN